MTAGLDMSPRGSVLPPGHPYTWSATSAPTASPRPATSTGAELLSRHRSLRVTSFVTIKTRGDLGAGSLNSKRSAEDGPLGLGRRGRAARNIRTGTLSEEVGHQGGDAAVLYKSVRLVDMYKERGESTVFLTSPPSSTPLLSCPPSLFPSIPRLDHSLLPFLHRPIMRSI